VVGTFFAKHDETMRNIIISWKAVMQSENGTLLQYQ